jgi:hypothetical protein
MTEIAAVEQGLHGERGRFVKVTFSQEMFIPDLDQAAVYRGGPEAQARITMEMEMERTMLCQSVATDQLVASLTDEQRATVEAIVREVLARPGVRKDITAIDAGQRQATARYRQRSRR